MLQDYQRKRDFNQTREPQGAPSEAARRNGLRFVVQKHAARRLHYDFRLEQGGVLKSWAVAKGPSLDPKVKRLAVMVEDHPLDYGGFEGVIAKGNYGAGEVIVWDNGIYLPDDGKAPLQVDRSEVDRLMAEGLAAGKLSFTLFGHKLRGSWTLVRTARSRAGESPGESNEWLLIKHQDEYALAEVDLLAAERSVISGLSIDDLKSGRLPDRTAGRLPSGMQAEIDRKGRPGPLPSFVKPMLATASDAPFSHPEWLFEPKLDGYRIVAIVSDGEVRLRSRNNLDYTGNFPSIADGLRVQPGELVLDGEIVALDEQGRPNFGLLQRVVNREIEQGQVALRYYAFDLLYHDGADLERVPLFARKALLARTLVPTRTVQPVDVIEAEGERLFEAAANLGLEGIVAKRRDSTYEPGRRSKAWLKIKRVQEGDFVIGGWTEGKGARGGTFGALLLGQYEDGKLTFAGRVGGGFDDAKLKEVLSKLSPVERKTSPFAGKVDLDGGKAHWVQPTLVARVRFAQWTSDGRLRAPIFVALRWDLEVKDVTKEDVVQPPPSVHAAGAATNELSADDVQGVLEQLAAPAKSGKLTLEVQGHRLNLTNLDKELWPAHGGQPPVTKRDLIRYYVRMSPVLLPHLKDRPITLVRFPDGITGEAFYQKHWGGRKPPYVESVRVFSSHNEGDVDFLLANNLPTFIAFAQQGVLELHPWNSRITAKGDAAGLPTTFADSLEAVEASVLNYPDFMVFDLDPYIYSGKEAKGAEPELNRKAFLKTLEIAKALKELLDQLSLSSFVKTSGKTGLHIYVPVRRQYTYDTVRKACETIGRFLLRQFPKDLTLEWSASKRTGRVFFDHNQNVRGKNMAAIYSPRPAPGAPVSTPVRWEELDSIYPPQFTMRNAHERLDAIGDLWRDILDAKHDLRTLLEPAQRHAA